MIPLALALLAAATFPATPIALTSNKPFVQVTIDGSAPQWFILDTGNNGVSVVARECAERLQLQRGAEERADIGAGSGADIRIATARHAVHLRTLGDTFTVAEPRVFALGHVSKVEGRRVDGLLGNDFLSTHVVEIDYAKRAITLRDPGTFQPRPDATVVPLNLETGWPIVNGTVTTRGGRTVPCRLIIDTGVRFTVALFRPFSERNGFYEGASLSNVVIGSGAGGVSRGDVARARALTLGGATFEEPVVLFARDTTGVFSADGPDGIVGGEILRRHRVTFDYPHARMILEPYPGTPMTAFEYDMSGLFLSVDAPDYAKIRVLSVGSETPAAQAGLKADDEIVSIDGKATPDLTLDQARNLLRTPGARRLEVRRDGQTLQVRLETKRLV